MRAQLTSATSKPWVRSLTKPFRRHAAVSLALGLVTACCAALLMFVSGYLICRTAQPATTLFMVMVPVALVQVFGIARPFARYFERLVSHDWVFRVTSRLRVLLFKKARLQASDPAAGRDTGEYLEFVVEDIAHLQNLYLRVAFPTTIALLLMVAGSLFCGIFSLTLGLAFLAFSVASSLIAVLGAQLVAKPMQERAKASLSYEYARLSDDIVGATDWALAGRVDEVRHEHERAAESALGDAAAVRRVVRVSELLSAVVLAVGVCVICAIAGDAFQGQTDNVNFIAAFALGFFPVAETFALLPHALVDSLNHADALNRLDGVIQDEAPHVDKTTGISDDAASTTAIEVSAASYRYPQNAFPTVSDLDLVIPTGQKVAVLGRSGSGKTTLARLLRGVIAPTEGTVNVIGTPASSFDADAPLVGFIPQAPHLFDDTLRNNLLLARPNATDEELLDALAKVGLAAKLQSLSCGLDTSIGETGAGFSGGEAHRLALARALLADYPIVLLDEPFTALDPVTESALLDTIFESFDDKTLVVITHHLAGIERFDRVIFIENGSVELDGSPRDLARGEPRFKQLLAFDRGISS